MIQYADLGHFVVEINTILYLWESFIYLNLVLDEFKGSNTYLIVFEQIVEFLP